MRSILTAVGLSLAIASTAVAQSGAPVYELNTKGVTAPAVIKEVKPVYPPDAKAEGVTGMVELQGVVESDGMIDRIKVTKSLDARLDAESIKALEQWQFNRDDVHDQVSYAPPPIGSTPARFASALNAARSEEITSESRSVSFFSSFFRSSKIG